MKISLCSFFIFLSFNLLAQPQKGDLYFGLTGLNFDNIQFNNSSFSRTILGLSPSYGRFITDNTLIGGGLLFSTSLSDLSQGNLPRNFFGLNLFYAQYFGKGKIKGLGQVTFNGNFVRNNSSLPILISDLGLGAAYFVNDFTSIQLLYNINFFKVEEVSDTEYFSTGLSPNIGLTLRTLLLRNREGIENLSALNSIKKRTKILDVVGSLSNEGDFYSHRFRGTFSYFFVDQLYGEIGFFNSLSKGVDFKSTGLSYFLKAAYYLKLSDKFYGKIATGISNENQFSKNNFNSSESLISTSNSIRWNSELGFALFWGAHKLDSGLGLRLSSTRLKEVMHDRISDFSPSFFVNYEWFLMQNFAFTTRANYTANNIFYSVSTTNFLTPIGTQVFENSIDRLSLNVGFKWYLSTPME